MMGLGISFYLLLSVLPGFALQSAPSTEIRLWEGYGRAVRDASVAESSETANDLTVIALDNPQLIWNQQKTEVLVVTWKSQSSYENFYEALTETSASEANVLWVTTAPQVQQFCRDYMRDNRDAVEEDLDLRLKQYLGLNPSWEYDVFIEMWVSPEEVRRPCVDPEVTDSQCSIDFGDPLPEVKNIKDYAAFYKNLYFESFRNRPGVPWTGLGYTYDWGNPLTEQGASEFIMIPGASYEIEGVTSTMDYCQAPAEQ